jgi:hypothetical protein
MSEESAEPTEGFDAQVEGAARRLQEANEVADAAERRAVAEIRALEADFEKERLAAAQAVEDLKAAHEEELKRERAAKEEAIAAAEGRLGEIETQADTAEQRIEAAERRAAEAERIVAERETGAREAAAAWLRGQIEAIRREAGR